MATMDRTQNDVFVMLQQYTSTSPACMKFKSPASSLQLLLPEPPPPHTHTPGVAAQHACTGRL